MKKRATNRFVVGARPLFRGAVLFCVSLVFLAGLSLASLYAGARAASPFGLAQQPTPKPKIAEDESQPPKGNKDPRGGKKNNSNKQNGTTGGGNVQRPRPQYDVLIVTSVPQAELFLRSVEGQYVPLGVTGDDGKRTIKLPRGKHFITASRQGYQIVRQQVDVRPGSNTFNFDLLIASTKDPNTPEVEETPAPTPEPVVETVKDEAAENAARVEQIFSRFLDTNETANVPESDWDFVLSQMGQALAKDPANSLLQARALFSQGQIAFLRKDYPQALVLFNKAALAEPKFMAALYGLGNAYMETNQPGEAFKAYNRASQLDAQFALAYKGMGDALVKQKKVKESKRYYERFQSSGGQPETKGGLAEAVDLIKRKRWKEALPLLQELSKTEPSAVLFVYIGDCYVGLGQPYSASQSYLGAIELDQKSAQAHYKYGIVMYELREYAQAFEHLERALALDQTGANFNRERVRKMANEAQKKIKPGQ